MFHLSEAGLQNGSWIGIEQNSWTKSCIGLVTPEIGFWILKSSTKNGYKTAQDTSVFILGKSP